MAVTSEVGLLCGDACERHCIYLYVSYDPRDGGFPGGRHGWGGGIITFLELADMVDATQEVGGGVGWG